MKSQKDILLNKIKTGEKLTPKETREFENLKDEYGVNISNTVKSLEALAKIIGVSRQTLHTWKKEPGFPIEPDGSYSPEKIAAWKKLGSGTKNKDSSDTISDKVKWDIYFRKFRAKLAKVAYLKEKGELIPRAEVEELLVSRAVEFKKAIISRGRILSLRLANKDAVAIQGILDEDSLEILKSYSRPNNLIEAKNKKNGKG